MIEQAGLDDGKPDCNRKSIVYGDNDPREKIGNQQNYTE